MTDGSRTAIFAAFFASLEIEISELAGLPITDSAGPPAVPSSEHA